RRLAPAAGAGSALCAVLADTSFIVFSLISGKQPYYLFPEAGGIVLLMAGAIAVLRERQPALANNGWFGTWPLGAGGIGFAVLLFALPLLVDRNMVHGDWANAAAPYSRYFSVIFLLLGILLLLRGRGELRRLAVAGLVGVFALTALFTLTLLPRWDLR